MIAVVVPCHAPRLTDLEAFLRYAWHKDLQFLVVTNEPEPIELLNVYAWGPNVAVHNTGSEEINLSKWWNIGHRWAKNISAESLLVTESDCRLSPHSIFALEDAMKRYDLSLVGPNLYGLMPRDDVHITNSTTSWGGRTVFQRICQTWMKPVDVDVQADERFVWWYADEQMDMLHRGHRKGTGVIGSITYEEPPVQTTDPSADAQRREGNIRARKLFKEQWGFGTLA